MGGRGPGWRVTPHVSLRDVGGFLARPRLNSAGPRGGQGEGFLALKGPTWSHWPGGGEPCTQRLPELGPGTGQDRGRYELASA